MKPRRSLTAVAVAAAALTFGADAAADPPDRLAAETVDDAGRMAAGVAITSIGGAAILGGGMAYAILQAQPRPVDCPACDPHKAGKTGSILAVVLGGASVAVGIPLMLTADESVLSGGKRERRRADLPELRVGLGGGSLTWKF